MKEKKQKLNDMPFDAELEIFGEHKTKEQIRAEEKIRRKEEREALKQEMERRRQEAKAEGGVPARRKDVITVGAVTILIVLLSVLALTINSCRADKNWDWEINSNRGQFVKTDASPEMSGEGPMADVSAAYFTNNGHLCVEMLISNGTDKMLSINAMDVSAFDYVSEERIGGGRAVLDEPLIIEVAGVTSYTFYIAPEHLTVAEDYTMPDMVYFEISIDHTPAVTE